MRGPGSAARLRRTIGLLVLAALLAGPGAGAEPVRKGSAEAARREMRAAESARAAGLAARREATAQAARSAAAERQLTVERAAATARLREAEEATARVAARLEALAQAQAEAEARLAARAADLAPILPVIQRLSLHPGETMLAVLPDQASALRGALVLRALAGQIEAEAARARADQAALSAARAAVTAEQARLTAARNVQAERGGELDRRLEAVQATRQAALEAAEQAARQAAEQAARAESLRAAIAEIEAARQAAEAAARTEATRAARARQRAVAAAARQRQTELASPRGAGTIAATARPDGQLLRPVAGSLVRAWGAPTEAGPANGLTWRPPPGARVLAPCAGKVMFAAPFRSFGLLVILDCGGGHHAVLSGLDRATHAPGHRLREGEPIGIMANWDPATPGARPALYMELRRDGRPIDPTPWLKAG